MLILMYCAAMFSLVELVASYSGGAWWKLAYNVHPSDGHNFGYQAEEWEDNSDLGNASTAFTADYKSYSVTEETANFIAIVRHQSGVCEAVGVWEFLIVGKTLRK